MAAMRIHSSHAISGEGVVSSFHTTTSHILVGFNDGTIHVFDTDGAPVHALLEPAGSVCALAASGNTLLSGGMSGSLRLWDLVSGTQLRTLQGHGSLVRSLYWAEHPDPQANHHAASGSSDGQIRIWDVSSGHCVHVLCGHATFVYCLAMRGDALVSTSGDRTARIWSLGTGTCRSTLRGHSQAVMSLIVHGESVITAGLDGGIRLWRLRDGSPLALLAQVASPISALRIDADASTLLASTTAGWLLAWSLPTQHLRWARKAHDHAVTAMALYRGLVVSGGKDGGGYENACGLDAWVRVWDVDGGGGEGVGGEGGEEDGEDGDGGGHVSEMAVPGAHDRRCVELGPAAEVVWRIGSVRGGVALLVSRRGGVVLEVWSAEGGVMGGGWCRCTVRPEG
ncbi:hypothetical protein MMC26_005409 [Xylographa opegraphella]|nr:hypothetical protein [Xylographa opegraphella]